MKARVLTQYEQISGCQRTPCVWRILTLLAGLFAAAEGEDVVRGKLRAVYEELTERFRTLEEEFR